MKFYYIFYLLWFVAIAAKKSGFPHDGCQQKWRGACLAGVACALFLFVYLVAANQRLESPPRATVSATNLIRSWCGRWAQIKHVIKEGIYIYVYEQPVCHCVCTWKCHEQRLPADRSISKASGGRALSAHSFSLIEVTAERFSGLTANVNCIPFLLSPI